MRWDPGVEFINPTLLKLGGCIAAPAEQEVATGLKSFTPVDILKSLLDVGAQRNIKARIINVAARLKMLT